MIHLEWTDVSGLLGSISIACWMVVFSPQIYENYRRSSAKGLSLQFLVIWLIGDICNVVAAFLQNVLPTMIILAIYYSIADGVLIVQYWYYGEGKNDDSPGTVVVNESSETTNLLAPDHGTKRQSVQSSNESISERPQKDFGSFSERRFSHGSARYYYPSDDTSSTATTATVSDSTIRILKGTFQTVAIVLTVFAAGFAGWWLTVRAKSKTDNEPDNLDLEPWAQVFGYTCALFYIGSRVPQITFNFKRKSTEGISLLFFLFAFLGNIVYVASILCYLPKGHDPANNNPGQVARLYRQHLIVNASWILGGIATPLLDLVVFVQFLVYDKGILPIRASRP